MEMESFFEFIRWFERMGFQWVEQGDCLAIAGPDGWRLMLPRGATLKQAYSGMMAFFRLYEDLTTGTRSSAYEMKRAPAYPWLSGIAEGTGITPEPFVLKRAYGSPN